jgi:hypothetical protein
MLKKRILNGKSQMKMKKLAICHLPFAISDQAGVFSGLLDDRGRPSVAGRAPRVTKLFSDSS